MGLFDLFKKNEENVEQKFELPPDPAQKIGKFEMKIEDIFTIGSNTVVTGKIISGSIALGDDVVVRENGRFAKVIGIEMFRKKLEYAQAGDNIGIFLSGVSRDDLNQGNTLIQ